MRAEQVDVTVNLDRVLADQAPLFMIKQGDASGCMPRYMNYLQLPFAKIDPVFIKYRKDSPLLMEDVMVYHHLRRVHFEF